MKEQIERILREAGKQLLPYFGNVEIKARKSNNPTDLLTELDIQTEEYIRDELAKVYPDIGFVGEETGGDRTAEKFWLLDPIDGTVHFVRGIPFCTTMLALIDNGEVVLSAIYNFALDEMYFAEKGKGATKNGKPIHVSNRGFEDGAYFCYETNIHANERNSDLYNTIRTKAVIVRTINAGFEFGLIAEGKLEGRVMLDPFGKDYDFAPGSLLVAEAGGIVKNIGSNAPYDYTNLDALMINPKLYKELTEGPDALFPVLA